VADFAGFEVSVFSGDDIITDAGFQGGRGFQGGGFLDFESKAAGFQGFAQFFEFRRVVVSGYHPFVIEKLISGGQTGADIAALDVALRFGFPHGGWCPKGRWSLEGPIPTRYNLFEKPSASYLQRTEWNVRDSGG
jgi:hypothetical protein